MEHNLPVLVVTYNRPDNLGKMLNQISTLGIKKIYIAIDGPKNGTDSVIVSKNSKTIQQFIDRRYLNIKVWFRSENLGLVQSMLSAIDWFFSHENRGIILEDDLNLTKSFFEFAEHGLEIYESNSEIFMVTGNQFFSEVGPRNAVSIANYPLIWGWATWSSRWQKFRNTLDESKVPKNNAKIKNNVYFFWKMGYIKSVNLQNQSWAILLATYMRFSKLISVVPNSNLVSNVGFGEASTNTLLPNNFLQIAATETKISNFVITNAKNLTQLLEQKIFRISLKHYLLFFKIMLYSLNRASSQHNLIESLKALKIKSMKEQT